MKLPGSLIGFLIPATTTTEGGKEFNWLVDVCISLLNNNGNTFLYLPILLLLAVILSEDQSPQQSVIIVFQPLWL